MVRMRSLSAFPPPFPDSRRSYRAPGNFGKELVPESPGFGNFGNFGKRVKRCPETVRRGRTLRSPRPRFGSVPSSQESAKPSGPAKVVGRLEAVGARRDLSVLRVSEKFGMNSEAWSRTAPPFWSIFQIISYSVEG